MATTRLRTRRKTNRPLRPKSFETFSFGLKLSVFARNVPIRAPQAGTEAGVAGARAAWASRHRTTLRQAGVDTRVTRRNSASHVKKQTPADTTTRCHNLSKRIGLLAHRFSPALAARLLDCVSQPAKSPPFRHSQCCGRLVLSIAQQHSQ